MKHLTVQEAKDQGYRPITSDLWPDRESDKPIIASIEENMRGKDAVWIDMPYEAVQAARKRRELVLPEDEVKRIKA
jgi:hypothetical protein